MSIKDMEIKISWVYEYECCSRRNYIKITNLDPHHSRMLNLFPRILMKKSIIAIIKGPWDLESSKWEFRFISEFSKTLIFNSMSIMLLPKECMPVVLQLIRLLLLWVTRYENPCLGKELGLEFQVLLTNQWHSR